MNLCFVGTGYVGLVSATCFAEMGNQVYCVDVDINKVEQLKSGKLTIYEPGLEDVFVRNLREGRLLFTNDLQDAAAKCEIIFLTLPTPPQEDGSADLSYVLEVCNALIPLLKTSYKILVTKSTVPVGTSHKISQLMEAGSLSAGIHFDMVSNPEFLREGSAVLDFLKPERVVIGTNSGQVEDTMRNLYEPFVRNGNPILFMDPNSSELVKYAANGFLAMKISFINEIANLCDRTGANVDNVRKGIGTDSRIGHQFLYAGLGYGGSCFPKDVQALAQLSESFDYSFEILKAVMRVNIQQREQMANKILTHFGSVAGKKLAFWGLAFKPNTDDVRESPSVWLIEEMVSRGAIVSAFDPEAMENTKRIIRVDIDYHSDKDAAVFNCDALIITTEWNEFRSPDWSSIKENMITPVVFDGRNLFEPGRMADMGFLYYSIGRKTVEPILIDSLIHLAV